MTENVLVVDQGTTSTRGIVYGRSGRVLAETRRSLRQVYPAAGFVEQDPDDIWTDTLAVIREASVGHTISAVGIANQRETTILWDRNTGRQVHNAIAWQDRRTVEMCARITEQGYADVIAERTGLVIDPYFSASKIAWLLDNVRGLRDRAMRGEILFGTVDSYIIWRLTNGASHVTDATNASRTMLYDIHKGAWDQELLDIWRIPPVMMPNVLDCAADFGRVREDVLPNTPVIAGVAGDQHAAMIGQACFEPGMMKSTYGTGAFLVMNTGTTPVRSRNRLLTTIAYRLNGQTNYALEGSIFNAGTTVQWLRDEMEIIARSEDIEWLATQAGQDGEVVIVPAFTGLGAPHWRADALAGIFGLTPDSGQPELARAALEAVAFQTLDILNAMRADGAPDATELRIDGGMVSNNMLSQMVSDFSGYNVVRPRITETTALGAALLASLGAGIFRNLDEVRQLWRSDREFRPNIPADLKARKIARWNDAVRRLLA